MNIFGKSRLSQVSIGATLVLMAVVVGMRLSAQTPTASTPGASQAPSGLLKNASTPVEILYYHLFMLQAHLEKVAAQADPNGGGQGQSVRTSLQTQIGMSDQDFAQFETSCLHFSELAKGFNQQAQGIVVNVRALRKSGGWNDTTSAPYKAQLRELEQQRRSAIKAEITDLESHISEDGKNLLRAYVQGEIAKRTTTTTRTVNDIKAAARAARKGNGQ